MHHFRGNTSSVTALEARFREAHPGVQPLLGGEVPSGHIHRHAASVAAHAQNLGTMLTHPGAFDPVEAKIHATGMLLEMARARVAIGKNFVADAVYPGARDTLLGYARSHAPGLVPHVEAVHSADTLENAQELLATADAANGDAHAESGRRMRAQSRRSRSSAG